MEPELERQFGRAGEFTRALFVSKILDYFKTSGVELIYSEIPNIEKYEIRDSDNENFATAPQIIKYFPDLLEKLPLIAVTTTSGRKKAMNVGFPYGMVKNHNSLLVSTLSEPYVLAVNDDIIFSIDDRTYTVIFYTNGLPDFNNVTINDLSEYMSQVLGNLRIRNIDGKVGIDDTYGRDIYIIGGSAVTKLGFTVGQGPDTSRFYEYMMLAEDMEVLVDVMSSDRNQRIEIMDIISTLLGFYVFDGNIGQWFSDNGQVGQVIFGDELSRRGEDERDLEGVPYSKVYSDSVSVPVSTFLYLERVRTDESIEQVVNLG